MRALCRGRMSPDGPRGGETVRADAVSAGARERRGKSLGRIRPSREGGEGIFLFFLFLFLFYFLFLNPFFLQHIFI
jgi:hypothetical protein